MENSFERRNRAYAYLVHHNGRGGPNPYDGRVFLWLVCANINQFNSSDVPFSPRMISEDCLLRLRDVAKACDRLFEAGLVERIRISCGGKKSSYYRVVGVGHERHRDVRATVW